MRVVNAACWNNRLVVFWKSSLLTWSSFSVWGLSCHLISTVLVFASVSRALPNLFSVFASLLSLIITPYLVYSCLSCRSSALYAGRFDHQPNILFSCCCFFSFLELYSLDKFLTSNCLFTPFFNLISKSIPKATKKERILLRQEDVNIYGSMRSSKRVTARNILCQ